MTYATIAESELNIFERPARLLVSGYRGSGKSTLVEEIIKKYRDLFERVILLGTNLEKSDELKITNDNDFNPFEEQLTGKT